MVVRGGARCVQKSKHLRVTQVVLCNPYDIRWGMKHVFDDTLYSIRGFIRWSRSVCHACLAKFLHHVPQRIDFIEKRFEKLYVACQAAEEDTIVIDLYCIFSTPLKSVESDSRSSFLPLLECSRRLFRPCSWGMVDIAVGRMEVQYESDG